MNSIDDLYKNSGNDRLHAVTNKSASWSELEKSLRFQNFMRFSYYSFNIYYSIGLFLVLSGSIYYLINQEKITETPSIPNQNNESTITSPSVIKKDRIPSDVEKEEMGKPAIEKSLVPTRSNNVRDEINTTKKDKVDFEKNVQDNDKVESEGSSKPDFSFLPEIQVDSSASISSPPVIIKRNTIQNKKTVIIGKKKERKKKK